MRRRSRVEIYLDILRASMKVHKPTRIMYSSNLSWKPLQEYLKNLKEMGLITEERKNGHRLYYITENGKNVLSYLGQLRKILPLEKFS